MIERDQALAALAGSEFDVVVIGGGITGAGVALDASTRGYSVALLERADYAAGTSSRSSKLVHGGLRYLQNFDLGLVREALLERQLMVSLAPHLVRPLPLVVPAFEGARPDRLMGVGLNLYDVMSVERGRRRGRRGDGPSGAERSWSPERHRMISGEEVLELLPALAPREPTGGYLFYDCQTDDVRLVLTVLGEAERFGAVCANRVAAIGLLEGDGRAQGVRAVDREGGEEFLVRAATWSTPPACGPTSWWGVPPRARAWCRARAGGRELPRAVPWLRVTGACPRSAQPRHPPHASPRGPAAASAARSYPPARAARSSRCPGWGVRS